MVMDSSDEWDRIPYFITHSDDSLSKEPPSSCIDNWTLIWCGLYTVLGGLPSSCIDNWTLTWCGLYLTMGRKEVHIIVLYYTYTLVLTSQCLLKNWYSEKKVEFLLSKEIFVVSLNTREDCKCGSIRWIIYFGSLKVFICSESGGIVWWDRYIIWCMHWLCCIDLYLVIGILRY